MKTAILLTFILPASLWAKNDLLSDSLKCYKAVLHANAKMEKRYGEKQIRDNFRRKSGQQNSVGSVFPDYLSKEFYEHGLIVHTMPPKKINPNSDQKYLENVLDRNGNPIIAKGISADGEEVLMKKNGISLVENKRNFDGSRKYLKKGQHNQVVYYKKQLSEPLGKQRGHFTIYSKDRIQSIDLDKYSIDMNRSTVFTPVLSYKIHTKLPGPSDTYGEDLYIIHYDYGKNEYTISYDPKAEKYQKKFAEQGIEFYQKNMPVDRLNLEAQNREQDELVEGIVDSMNFFVQAMDVAKNQSPINPADRAQIKKVSKSCAPISGKLKHSKTRNAELNMNIENINNLAYNIDHIQPENDGKRFTVLGR
jgi:hypothetical protein